MSNCKRCGVSVPDGHTLCQNCQSDVWSAFSAADSADSVGAPATENTHYIGSAFDMPFCDSDDNLGFDFTLSGQRKTHKIREKRQRKRLSKRAKRNVAVAAVVAVAVAAVLVADSVFGIFPRKTVTPVVYVKDSAATLAGSNGSLYGNIDFSGNALSANRDIGGVERICFSPNYKYMYIAEESNYESDKYTLYMRKTFSNETYPSDKCGLIVGTGISGRYYLIDGGRSVLYYKFNGTGELRCYTFGGDSNRLCENVSAFGVLGDEKVVYIGKSSSLNVATVTSDGQLNTEKIDSDVESLYLPSDYGTESNNFFYMRRDRNYVSGEETFSLCYYNGKSSTVAEGVSSLIYPEFDTGAAYYSVLKAKEFRASDIIDDDCSVSDANIGPSDGYTLSLDEMFAARRNAIRSAGLDEWKVSVNLTCLKYFDGKGNVSDICESYGSLICGTEAGGVRIIYTEYSASSERQPFSSLAFDQLSYSYFSSTLRNLIKDSYEISGTYLSNAGSQNEVAASEMNMGCFSADGKHYAVGYVSKARDTDADCTVYKGAVGAAAKAVCSNATDIFFCGDKLISIDADGLARADGEIIAKKVNQYSVNTRGDAAYILSDVQSGIGKFARYSGGTLSDIDSGVRSYYSVSDDCLMYLRDFNATTLSCDLYIQNGKAKSRRVDTGVSALIRTGVVKAG